MLRRTAMDEFEVPWDEGALRGAQQIERSIVRLGLDSQAEFVSLMNAILVQLEAGAPDPRVLQLLFDALRALADFHGLDRKRLKLDERIDKLLRRADAHRSRRERRIRQTTHDLDSKRLNLDERIDKLLRKANPHRSRRKRRTR